MAKLYSLGRQGERDVNGLVRRGHLPPSALTVEHQAAVVRIGSLPWVWLDFVAYGNEDTAYGEVARAELARRERMEAV